MGIVLALLSVALLLTAAGLLLWSGAQRRARAQASLSHTQQQLQRSAQANVTAIVSNAAVAAPAANAGPVSSAQNAPRELPWNGLLIRAGLSPGWRLPLLFAIPGLAFAAFAAMRLGTGWAAPLAFLLYALVIWLLLQKRVSGRQRKLIRQLPDFLDNLVRLTALGNSLQMAFQTASQTTLEPLRGLLDTTVRNARSGMDLDRALSQAAAPYRIEALEVLAVVMGVCVRIGGRSDQVLQRMSDFMRDLDQAQQELKATTAETRTSAWVLGLLPPLSALFMALVSPEFFEPMLHDPLGHKIMLGALCMELIGGFLLYRLAKAI